MTDTYPTITQEGIALPERPRLLVVDDQPVNIQALYQIFQEDHEVFLAKNGEQALEVARDQSPDLILLDVIMPDMDGIEVCRRLKADREMQEIPIIFVTSQGTPDEETRGLEVGAVDFITKPVNPAVVRARVNTHLVLKAQSDLLKSLAFVDGLTGIPNRRQFDERLDVEWRACLRTESKLSVLMIDVDHFKLYNDHYGHQQGDECLQSVAAALRGVNGRSRDLVARYGGEEFACLLPECDVEGAEAKGLRYLQAVTDLELEHGASLTAGIVTISIGVATGLPDPGSDPAAILSAADHQLYRAKLRGRNTMESGRGLPPAA